MSFIIDPQSRFLEMKSLQPYSTTDEYLYAMKEDLADWLSTMYPKWTPITADTFLECLENGVLLCHHANNVNDAALKSSSIKLDYCKYRADARPRTFNARDNVSQFIRWARHSAGVREVLMFESDDLILRKNEKNFLLCLFEIARYGAKFGVSVPSLIKLEEEIDREIQRDKQTELVPSFIEQKKEIQSTSISTDTIDYQSNFFSPQETHLDNLCQTENNDEMNQTITIDRVNANDENKPIEAPASSSHLHKTVVQIVNSCCCAHRFPFIRIGEGKYRIGENGTIIFIRILRHHVMVRVGGGWDTLENYLNKHDPCRFTGNHTRRISHHYHTADIPILALPNHQTCSSSQKNSTPRRSITVRTDEFPLKKADSNQDLDLSNAKLLITRDADGRHRIGHITYQSEQEKTSTCPKHSISSPKMKQRTAREIVRSAKSGKSFEKQSSPSTDQDYSSFTETSASKPSSSSSFDLKEEEEWIERAINALGVSKSEDSKNVEYISPKTGQSTEFSLKQISQMEPVYSRPIIHTDSTPSNNMNIMEFDSHDIEEAMKTDFSTMDNDSLESSEGVLEEKRVQTRPPYKKNSNSTTSVNRPTARYTTPRPKPNSSNRRSQSSEILDLAGDTSKIDRDSGFDEQDFRRERLHSNGDDNSSVSSIRSVRTPIIYRENKSSELRLKKLQAKRQNSDQTVPIDKSGRSSRCTSRDRVLSSSKDRKLSQPILKMSGTRKSTDSLSSTVIKIIP